MNTKLRMPIIITGGVTALVTVYMSGFHCCYLQSIYLEVPLLILTPLLCCLWTARAKTSGKAWLRTGLTFVFVIAIQMAYLTWLHSDSFPKALLSRRSIEEKARFQKWYKEINTQPTNAPYSSPATGSNR